MIRGATASHVSRLNRVRRASGVSRARRVGAVVAAVCVAAALAACSDDGPQIGGDNGDGSGVDPYVATFQVVDEQFKVELVTPELIDHARELMAGGQDGRIPLGTVVRGDPGVNAPWTWHIDPATLEFADMTIEVCDGLPSFVEDATVTSDQYCPWSAEIVALDPA
ncbi:MAG: hypothetical protein ABW328_09450 [Ilumatobacteraceae bacterium]